MVLSERTPRHIAVLERHDVGARPHTRPDSCHIYGEENQGVNRGNCLKSSELTLVTPTVFVWPPAGLPADTSPSSAYQKRV
ncbi:hypothetical protein J6590_061635 [Homalodisca vitripennis]|nr:hypothetical protein J6590_061635 [Homalodisca vitripennis]